jgi:hypothetical protein
VEEERRCQGGLAMPSRGTVATGGVRCDGGNRLRQWRWLELGDDEWSGRGGPAKAERAGHQMGCGKRKTRKKKKGKWRGCKGKCIKIELCRRRKK